MTVKLTAKENEMIRAVNVLKVEATKQEMSHQTTITELNKNHHLEVHELLIKLEA